MLAGDINCATVGTPYVNYMWNGITGLFLKMEQNNLWNEINFNLATMAPDNATAIRRTVPGLVCPSYRRAQATAVPTGTTTVTGVVPPASLLGPSDYRGNMAAGMNLPSSANGCPVLDPTNPFCLVYDNGIMYQNSTINMADITDGSSMTVIFGESLTPTGVWSQAITCCVRTNIDRNINVPILFNGQNYYTYWMSKHPNLVNFSFCDGSVRRSRRESTSLYSTRS